MEWTMSIRFLRSSSLSCGASGRGGVLGIELISDTIGKLNTIYVATSDDNFIPLYVLTQAYWTVVLDLGDWDSGETVVVVLPHACFGAFLVLPCARILLLVDWHAGCPSVV